MKPEDFNKLRYNVYNLSKSKTVLGTWPELNIPQLNPPVITDKDGKEQRPFRKLSVDKVLRYILVLYDPNSPLHLLPTLMQQKVEAAKIAGWEHTEGKFPTNVVGLFRSEIGPVVDAILYYSRTHHPNKWSTYITLTLRHFNDQELMVKDPKEAPSTKVFMENTEIMESLKEELIYKDKTIEKAFEITIMDELGLRPEEVGKKILNGDRVVDLEPYK